MTLRAAAFILFTSSIVAAQGASRLDALTVPADLLDGSCRLASSERAVTADGRSRVIRWAGLQIPNPWRGDDAAIVATIRERVLPPHRIPDGPPPSRAEQARFRLRLADDVEEAYVAMYTNEDYRLVSVHALTFKERIPDLGERPPVPLFTSGRTLIVVRGTAGRCGELVRQFVAKQVAAVR
jgi:hypothetical protein